MSQADHTVISMQPKGFKRLGILLGVPGSGKTTLLNILISRSRVSILKTIFIFLYKLILFWKFPSFFRFIFEFKQLCTKVHQLYKNFRINKCRYRDKGFEIMDTPGYEGYLDFEQFQQQGKQFFACLNDQWVNRLFIVCKYDRIPNMKSNIDIIYRSLQQYSEIVTIIVTDWDQCDNNNIKEEIQKSIMRSYRLSSIIFSALQENEMTALTEQMYESMKNEPIKINLENTSFDRRVDKSMLTDLKKAFQAQPSDESPIDEQTFRFVGEQWVKQKYWNFKWRT